ncbi:MAG: hypothetical protein AAFQ94_09245 [Bacteroidota bacterium]
MNKVINDRFKEFRTEIGVSVTSLAQELGKARGSIYDIDNYRRAVHTDEIDYLIEKYNLNANWLFTGKGEKFQRTSTDVIDAKGMPAVLEKLRKLLDSEDHYLVDELKVEIERLETIEKASEEFAGHMTDLTNMNVFKLLFPPKKK